MKVTKERLEARSIPEPNSGCLLWLGSYCSAGYGTVWVDGQTQGAHRVAWSLKNGPIPAGMSVCHKCDVRGCINSDHLFLGTHKENMADMCAKGRQGRRDNRSPRIPTSIIRAVFNDGGSLSQLVAKFGVSRSTAWRVRTKRARMEIHDQADPAGEIQ